MRLPTYFLPHGGGPCFFMDWDPADTWDALAAWLRELGGLSGVRSLLVVSAHWEAAQPTVLAAERPGLLFDYSGFPEHTYRLSWPAPGAPELASRVQTCLATAGLEMATETERGWDHGVFVPLKVAFPEPTLPTLQLSLVRGLHPLQHLAIGRALTPLREEGVLILGSGMSFHNLRAMSGNGALQPGAAAAFDDWLHTACVEPAHREERLSDFERAPHARYAHPRAEHLLPLMVAAGAAHREPGVRTFHQTLLHAPISGFRFG